jgi:hypothetical protein
MPLGNTFRICACFLPINTPTAAAILSIHHHALSTMASTATTATTATRTASPPRRLSEQATVAPLFVAGDIPVESLRALYLPPSTSRPPSSTSHSSQRPICTSYPAVRKPNPQHKKRILVTGVRFSPSPRASSTQTEANISGRARASSVPILWTG